MRATDIIEKKRDGKSLSSEEIRFFIQGFTKGEIPDYQASAWAMAVLLKGMTARETADLTLAMAESGDQIDLSSAVNLAADKHSTGGVGDKTSLVVLPLVAACGVPVAKMSGRGLSFTGGTLDKMESIPGFRSDLTIDAFLEQLGSVGLVLAGQTGDLAPADGKLYALRDVTGTVPSIPLIASSVMSKKIAAGAQAIVLDVKVGLGAFMGSVEDAKELARLMVEIGDQSGREVFALISDMNQPLGRAIGNSLEVAEAIDTLRGGGPEDFRRHALEISSHMLILGKGADSLTEAGAMCLAALGGGQAFAKFKEMVSAQGGQLAPVEDTSLLPKAEFVKSVASPKSGWIGQIQAHDVGIAVLELGGGREKKGDPIDHAVGVEILHKVGDHIQEGESLFVLHASDRAKMESAEKRLMNAHEIVEEKVEPLPLFYGTYPD
jgi:pyrimidine-nucleoside phosphorylase